MAERTPERTRQWLLEVVRADGRYPIDAYDFLSEGLSYGVEKFHGPGPHDKPCHLTGQQLCQALRELAIRKWGLLAGTVLRRWNIHATIDFGNMVYLLVRNDLMGKTDEDCLEHFQDVFDFAAVFDAQELELAE